MGSGVGSGVGSDAVSYTHLTLPTKSLVYNSVVSVALQKQQSNHIITS